MQGGPGGRLPAASDQPTHPGDPARPAVAGAKGPQPSAAGSAAAGGPLQDPKSTGQGASHSKPAPRTGRFGAKLPAIVAHSRAVAKRVPFHLARGSRYVPTRALVIGLELIGGLLLVACIAVIVAHARLSNGPIAVDFLVAPIERAINRDLSGMQVRINQAILRYSENEELQFRLSDVKLVGSDGEMLAEAPFASVGLSGAALTAMRIAPSRIELIEPRIRLSYSQDNGLSLSFNAVKASAGAGAAVDAAAPAQGQAGSAPAHSGEEQFLLAKSLTRALSEARRHQTASSYLTSLGLRDASVIFANDGSESHWRVPRFGLEFEHRNKRSLISGAMTVAADRNDATPFDVQFEMVESARQNLLQLHTTLTGLIPNELPEGLPVAGFLRGVNSPVAATASFKLDPDGVLLEAEGKFKLEPAIAAENWPEDLVETVSGGLRYTIADGRVIIDPTRIDAGASSVTLKGFAIPRRDGDGASFWSVELAVMDGEIGDTKLGLEALPLVAGSVQASIFPSAGSLRVHAMRLRLPDGEIALAGEYLITGGLGLNAVFGSMPPENLVRFWPPVVAPLARTWVAERISGGRITGGKVRAFLTAEQMHKLETGGTLPADALSVDLGTTGLGVTYVIGLPQLVGKTAEIKLRGHRFDVKVPAGQVTLKSGKSLGLQSGTFTIDNVTLPLPMGRADFRGAGDVAAALELLDMPPLGYISAIGISDKKVSGQTETKFSVTFPLKDVVKLAEMDIKVDTTLHDVRIADAFGKIDVQGGDVKIGLSEQALEATGDILINGVPAKLSWLRLLDQSERKQPPLRITADLDESDRDLLGLPINKFVRGTIPTIVTVTSGREGQLETSVQADLTNAELLLDDMAWRKPPGQQALLQFDVRPGKDGRTELQSFKVFGDEIAIDGWIALDKDSRLAAFYFPDFSFNVVTHLQLAGELGADKVWDIKASGTTYDGRPLFRSLFAAGKATGDAAADPGEAGGVDLVAEISTMVGYSDEQLSDVRVKLKRRGGQISELTASGKLQTGLAVSVEIGQAPGAPRLLMARSKDAGSAFRLVGFYSSFQGGDGVLKVNLDGRGNAERFGTLWTSNFVILGDQVVDEVLANAPSTARTGEIEGRGAGASGAKRTRRRTQLAFDRMRLPFSIGQGQFVLHPAYINGPVLGATLKGKVDFNRDTMLISGTYVPLFGLNSALGSIPIIGDLLVGRKGEGVLGITFAIQGALSNPQVAVNPISAVAPGFLRQIFEFNPQNDRIDAIEPQMDENWDKQATQASSFAPVSAASGGGRNEVNEATPKLTRQDRRGPAIAAPAPVSAPQPTQAPAPRRKTKAPRPDWTTEVFR